MGVVHVFSYINVKDTPSRRRMTFFYAFCLIENTVMISIWCVEVRGVKRLPFGLYFVAFNVM